MHIHQPYLNDIFHIQRQRIHWWAEWCYLRVITCVLLLTAYYLRVITCALLPACYLRVITCVVLAVGRGQQLFFW